MSFKYICNIYYTYIKYLTLKLSIFNKMYALHLCWLLLYLSLIIWLMIKGQHITETESSEALCIQMERQVFGNYHKEKTAMKITRKYQTPIVKEQWRDGQTQKTFLEQNIGRHNGGWNKNGCEKEQETCERPFRQRGTTWTGCNGKI